MFVFLYIMFLIMITAYQVFRRIRYDYMYESVINHKLFYLPVFDNLDTYDKISYWINCNIKYDYTYSDLHKYANPEDTYLTGKGTCADYAILFLNIAYFGMNKKGDFVAVNSKSDFLSKIGIISHAEVCFDGENIDIYTGKKSNHITAYSYSFDEVFEKM